MTNKSKPNLFAAIVLRALLLVLPVSACAMAEDRQEIGAPQMMESFAKSCFGAVMSPDGKRIYILREGQLIQYQFNPFKKLGSIAVETAQVKSFKYAGACKVGLTRNESKIIIVSNIDISLFDAQTGRLLKSVSADGLERRLAFNGDDLVTMSMFDTRIAVLDANTLTYKHKEIDIGKRCGFENHNLRIMQNIMGSLYFISPQSVVMLNGETYECELSAKVSVEDHGYYGNYHLKQQISRDFRTLALKGVTEFRDFRRSSPARYDDMQKDDVLLFDLGTRTASVKKDNVPFEGVFIYALRSSIQANGHTFFSRGYQRNLSQHLVDTLIIDERVRKFTVITTYEAGEAISMEAFPGSKYGNFQMTPGARKYLMMKNGEGRVVSMNDATFKKYYRTAFEN